MNKCNTDNPFWLNKIKEDGVRLIVEIDLTYEQFKSLLEADFGYRLSDQDILGYWEIANRRILPSDCGSFSGIGHAINQLAITAAARASK